MTINGFAARKVCAMNPYPTSQSIINTPTPIPHMIRWDAFHMEELTLLAAQPVTASHFISGCVVFDNASVLVKSTVKHQVIKYIGIIKHAAHTTHAVKTVTDLDTADLAKKRVRLPVVRYDEINHPNRIPIP